MMNKIRDVFAAHPRAEWLIPLACCLILLTQVLFSVRQMSQQHADEATHLYAGYRVLKCGDYTYGREHPPRVKMLVAILRLLASNPPMDCVRGHCGLRRRGPGDQLAVFAGQLVAASDGGAGCIEYVPPVALCLGVVAYGRGVCSGGRSRRCPPWRWRLSRTFWAMAHCC